MTAIEVATTVAIVLASIDAPTTIEASLARFPPRAGRRGEVIVVDASRDDDRRAIASAISPRVRVLRRQPGSLAPELWRDGLRTPVSPSRRVLDRPDGPAPGWLAALLAGAGRDRRGRRRRADRARAMGCRRRTGRSTCSAMSTICRRCSTSAGSSPRRQRPLSPRPPRGPRASLVGRLLGGRGPSRLRDRGETLAIVPGRRRRVPGGCVARLRRSRQRLAHARHYGAGRSQGRRPGAAPRPVGRRRPRSRRSCWRGSSAIS